MKPELQDFTKTIGNRIKYILSFKEISQSELGERVGVKSISNILSGLQSLPLHVFYKICLELDCRADYLLFGKGRTTDSLDIIEHDDSELIETLGMINHKIAKSVVQLLQTDDGKEMIKEYVKATEKNKGKILEIAKIINNSKEV